MIPIVLLTMYGDATSESLIIIVKALTLNCPVSQMLHIEPNFLFQFKKGSPKNFLWASRLWVGRQQEHTLGYITKTCEKRIRATDG